MEKGDPRHRLSVCTRCLLEQGQPGLRLRQALRVAMSPELSRTFRIDGVACMAGCERPLTVGFSAAGKASYLFGDIDAERDAAHLLAFAELYASLADGWCNEGARPAGLAGKTMARIPGFKEKST